MGADTTGVGPAAAGAGEFGASSGAGTIRTAACRPPVLPDTVVERPAVIGRLATTPPGTLVAVTAPAGYGKTILTALWDMVDPRPFAWVNLDALDEDPAHLVAHVATALADRDLLDAEDLRFLSAPGRSPLSELLPAMLEMLDVSEPFVLVVDDVHRLDSPEARTVVAALVDGIPAAGVLVILSRAQLPGGLARRRLQGSVVEVGPTDLALDLAEAARVFAGLGVWVADDHLEEIVERCEGWAGGVHLSALALRDRDPSSPATTVTGRNRLLADYLVEEVLAGLDEPTALFLEEASVLEPMSATVLDSVLGRADSGQRLAAIETSGNLFLVALDEERTWYRFHHLFAELLTARLAQRDPARLRALHLRAAERFEGEGDIDRAIHHAVAGGDRRRAAALVQRDAIALVFAGRPGVLARRLARLDEVTASTDPNAALAQAWAAVADADVLRCRGAVEAALRNDDGGALADGSPSVSAAVALVRGFTGDGGLEGVLRNLTDVVDAGEPPTNPWWGMAMTVRATASIQLGRLADARSDLLAALERMPAVPGFEAAALMLLSWLDLRDDDLTAAVAHAEAGRRLADDHELQHVVPLLVIYSVDALVSARVGDRTRAAWSIACADASLERLAESSPRTRIFGHQVLAEAEHALQDGAEARRHLDQAVRAFRQHPLSPALDAENRRIRALLSDGPSGSNLSITPLTGAERRILPLLATHLSLPQIADELNVSRNTVKTHCVAVYRKLGVTSRADAVDEARRLGLIGSGAITRSV